MGSFSAVPNKTLAPTGRERIHGPSVFCPGGGIGRHAGLRSLCLTAWEFESPLGHHPPTLSQCESYGEVSRRSSKGVQADDLCIIPTFSRLLRSLNITMWVQRRTYQSEGRITTGRSDHTAKYRPWKLVWYAAFHIRAKAESFERYLKTASGRAFQKKHR